MSYARYKITKTSKFEKEFNKLPSEVQKRISDALNNEVADNPYKYNQLKGKYAGLRKLRVGDYRVLFYINENKKEVTVVELLKREVGYHKY